MLSRAKFEAVTVVCILITRENFEKNDEEKICSAKIFYFEYIFLAFWECKMHILGEAFVCTAENAVSQISHALSCWDWQGVSGTRAGHEESIRVIKLNVYASHGSLLERRCRWRIKTAKHDGESGTWQFLAAEQDEVQEVPVSKKKPQEEVKSKIQCRITSFSSKRKNKFIIWACFENLEFLKIFWDFAKNHQ